MSNELSKIQSEIKAPKGQMNKFGGYKYRSCEDIVEAAKPVLNKYGYALLLTDTIEQVGNRIYVKATASLNKEGSIIFSTSAYAREEESKKGMDGAQITGAASSYARKYALNGLFAIDDTKDADATNTHESKQIKWIDEGDANILRQLVYNSDLTPDEKEAAFNAIDTCPDYTMYQKIQHKLEARQQSIDTIPNPSQTDIKNHLRKTIKKPVNA